MEQEALWPLSPHPKTLCCLRSWIELERHIPEKPWAYILFLARDLGPQWWQDPELLGSAVPIGCSLQRENHGASASLPSHCPCIHPTAPF